jgi:hypothetical protein
VLIVTGAFVLVVLPPFVAIALGLLALALVRAPLINMPFVTEAGADEAAALLLNLASTISSVMKPSS